MKKYNLLLIISLIVNIPTFSQKAWQGILSVEDVCTAYPEQMEKMFNNLNLDYPGLEKVKKAYKKGDLGKACSELLSYYKNGDTVSYLRREQPSKGNGTVASADTILKDVITIQGVKGKLPYLANGHRNWYYKGPNNDEEWAWLSNRHSQISLVFGAYLETGNPKYAEYLDLFLRDFIIASWPYPAQKGRGSVWRGLEVAARIKNWSRIFYGMLNSGYLSPATQLLILSSLPDHADYNRNFHGQNNWLTMEISALATAATNFPEYKKSPEWLDYSINTMAESLKKQVYPDGVQTELTSHYHRVALSCFELFEEICTRAGKALPEFYVSMLPKMNNYIAYTMRPDGCGLMNNDGDLDYTRDAITNSAKKYEQNDWLYIATNGEEGIAPENGASFVSPWAGHLISRSGYGADAQWSFFDIGPWGSGHQHNDKLHLSVFAYGNDLLVDGGRFAYSGAVADKFRGYARGSQAHNVVLVDGKGQAPGPKLSEKPISEKQYKITPEYDYATASSDKFIDLEGECKHTRTFYYGRGKMWVVIDKIETDSPRKIETLWHWHPDCNVKVEGQTVFTDNPKGNLRIIPVGKQNWEINFIKGQDEPEVQGWYSEKYNTYHPNVASIYSTNIDGNSRFVWVLFPSEKVSGNVKAEIVSEGENEIKIRVNDNKSGEHMLTVPL